ncbi:hypothetical protein [Streptomyces violens]|uniref:hypothetical protein n=1 Tax=Streptomyces violens TaxID=66377 RepID=UPI0012FEA28E|nr:hypothetical protein [Streptomyces violens]
MRDDVVAIIRSFEQSGKVIFRQLDEHTWILVPTETGCPIVFDDLGDSLVMRTGIDVRVTMDYELETSRDALPEVIEALTNGQTAERFETAYRNRLSPSGYKIEYPSGSQMESGERQGREYSVRLPAWNAE